VPQLQRVPPFFSCFFEEEGSAPSKDRTIDLGFGEAHVPIAAQTLEFLAELPPDAQLG